MLSRQKLRRLFHEEYGKQYELAQLLAEEDAYERLDEYHPGVLLRLRAAVSQGIDPDLFARRFKQEAGPHRENLAIDLRNAGRHIRREMASQEAIIEPGPD